MWSARRSLRRTRHVTLSTWCDAKLWAGRLGTGIKSRLPRAYDLILDVHKGPVPRQLLVPSVLPISFTINTSEHHALLTRRHKPHNTTDERTTGSRGHEVILPPPLRLPKEPG